MPELKAFDVAPHLREIEAIANRARRDLEACVTVAKGDAQVLAAVAGELGELGELLGRSRRAWVAEFTADRRATTTAYDAVDLHLPSCAGVLERVRLGSCAQEVFLEPGRYRVLVAILPVETAAPR